MPGNNFEEYPAAYMKALSDLDAAKEATTDMKHKMREAESRASELEEFSEGLKPSKEEMDELYKFMAQCAMDTAHELEAKRIEALLKKLNKVEEDKNE